MKCDSNNIGVSIVIVTYNGGDKLLPTLAHLAKQKNIDFNLEVLLVDNNSSDNTSEKAKTFWSQLKAPFPLRIVLEPTPGTMYARKKGIESAQYRYMLYCDDDNWLHEDYVQTAFSIISSDSQIAAVGGKGCMEYEQGFTPPTWIGPYEKNYGTTAQGKEDGDTTYSKGCLYTAGAILDRAWLHKLYTMGFQSSLQGRDGKTLVAGEDTELTYALKLIGAKLYYSSKMIFQHYMPKERINWVYLKRLWESFGYSNAVISPYNVYFKKKNTPKLSRLLFRNMKEITRLTLRKYKHKMGEGDHTVLELEWKKGELRALIFGRKKYRLAQKTIKTLHQNI